ncbi:MAG: glycoside hydrolase family 15 protein [Chloroflexi bacterium]|nr:MAG: glycoside hydrolase family 15 protein [Chloroflexota bacterium]
MDGGRPRFSRGIHHRRSRAGQIARGAAAPHRQLLAALGLQGPARPAQVVERYKQSLLIIHTQIDHNGAILAANDTDISELARDTYSYMWPRDGALVSSALMHAGHAGAPERFLAFCSRVISPNGYLRHKYNPDGSLASTWHGYVRDGKPVLPIQEDETALVIWALGEYFDLYRRIEETAPFYRGLVTRPADFLLSYVDQGTGLPLPSYDLWEERWGVHAFTVAAVIAGLRAAGRLSTEFGETERAARYRGRGRANAGRCARSPLERAGAALRPNGHAGRQRLYPRHDRGLEPLRPGPLGRSAARRPAGGLHASTGRGPPVGAHGRRWVGSLRERLLSAGGATGYQAGARQSLVRLHHVAGTLSAPAGQNAGRSGSGAEAARVGRPAGLAVRHHGGTAASLHRGATLGRAAHLESRGVRAGGAGVHRSAHPRERLLGLRPDHASDGAPIGLSDRRERGMTSR